MFPACFLSSVSEHYVHFALLSLAIVHSRKFCIKQIRPSKTNEKVYFSNVAEIVLSKDIFFVQILVSLESPFNFKIFLKNNYSLKSEFLHICFKDIYGYVFSIQRDIYVIHDIKFP
jgi:hypothetical protein